MLTNTEDLQQAGYRVRPFIFMLSFNTLANAAEQATTIISPITHKATAV